MADYKTIETGNTDPRGFTLVAKESGNPITAGTVNHYLKALTGANAGKWWQDSDQSWQASETGNAMTHQADGHWSRTLAASPWMDGAEFLEYAKESGDLHVPVSRWLKAGYTPSANSSRQVTEANSAAILEDTGTTLPAQIGALNNLSQAEAQTAAAAALTAYDPPTRSEATSDKSEIITALAGITQAQRVRVLPPAMMERPDTGTVNYQVWIFAYNEQHKAEDLDDIPTVTAQNQAGVDRSANITAVWKPAGTTGQYYAEYSVSTAHAIEGLLFKVSATEDGGTTVYAAPSIVVDTTAVDFTAADRTDLQTLLTRIPGTVQPQTGDSYARLGAPAGVSVSADIAAVKTDTATLLARITSTLFSGITSLGNWLRLLGRKDASDATAKSEFNAGGGSYDEALHSQQGAVDTSSAPTVAEIDAQLSGSHGAGAWGASGASGARTITVTARNANTLAALPGALVTVKDSADSTIVDQKRTNSSGQAVFSLDDGSYKLHASPLPGYSGLASQALVVSANASVNADLTPLSAATPGAGTRTVQVIVYGPTGQPVSGEVVTARLLEDPATIDHAVLSHQVTTATTDSNGLASLALITYDQFLTGDGYYEIYSSNTGKYTFRVPAGSGAVNLQDLI